MITDLNMNQLIGQWLANRRRAKLIKQQFIAEQLGISRSTYSHIEAGRRSLLAWELIGICILLDASPGDFAAWLRDEVFPLCSREMELFGGKEPQSSSEGTQESDDWNDII
jgi:transcriptional regulator with XRE-family HTH domain